MTASSPPRFWPGLILNLLLPGAGLSYLGRPWLHLLALGLTVVAWLVLGGVLLTGIMAAESPADPEASSVLSVFVVADLLGVAALYLGLSLSYWRIYTRLSRTAPVQPRWWPVRLQLILLPLLVVLTYRICGTP